MAVREIRFGVRAVDTNGAASGGAINSGAAGAPNQLQPSWISTNTKAEYQQLLAFADDGVGVGPSWGGGVVADSAYNLSDIGNGGLAASLLADDTAADPVRFTAHGGTGKNKVGDLTGAVRFSDTTGFGLGNSAD